MTDAGPKGRFAKGNPGGPGNPLAKKANQLRVALSKAVTVADIRTIAKKMIDLAREGDIQAAKLVFDRALGPIVEVDVIERIEALEAAEEARQNEHRQEQTAKAGSGSRHDTGR